jgi:hypothetical protein
MPVRTCRTSRNYDSPRKRSPTHIPSGAFPTTSAPAAAPSVCVCVCEEGELVDVCESTGFASFGGAPSPAASCRAVLSMVCAESGAVCR